ncbi:MAG: type II toxin-antitoxin system HicA family toxin [Acidobacteriaceae bacterium]
MKLPRDLDGLQLAGLLKRFGYHVTRQTGSHMRLKSELKGTEHCVTIPDHSPLRVGTLNAILTDVGRYLSITRDELLKALLG